MTIRIMQLPLGPLQTNCYILACTTTRQAAVIDPAWDGLAIAREVEKQGWTVSHILLTHTHFDHVGGLAELKERTGVMVYAHPDALPMLARAADSAQMWGIAVETPLPPDQLLQEGDVIEIGELRAHVLFTPGHAPGHVCFYLPEHSILFDGDVLFQGSIGRTDLPGGNFDLLTKSIREKLMTLPDETTVLSGHGPRTTIGQERRANPFLN
ncbi:MAG: MBL fold metallo-hydrolase [Anaerolineales bacterium]|uniref:MBL fold metallo-hydrolase n=1 Tax=Promineifilum sp. TaxID=2664178 RepID=UPI001DC06872|nr:MBL fold metallo-hydrolase [Anaerolineales bacterium]MCO5181033.1 MBL fold metallo-hydrolase [Promineifilum sp.]